MRGNLRHTIFILLFSYISFHATAKSPDVISKFDSLKNYFMFPIKPKQANYLAGTMGELRPRHFHGGIDIKTEGKTGLPVYAAADGYVYRIKVSTSGYGNALYIRHTNGYISTYAHLSKYKKEIAKYVLDNQYKKKKFQIELFPSKEGFPVKKGDIIAFSGNSGSSQGPHLHFEIRTPKEVPINVLKLNFKEIKDNLSPRILKIALKTLDPQSRINKQFGRFEFPVIRDKKGRLSIRGKIKAHGQIGVQLLCYDQMNGSYSKNGVPEIDLYLNDSLKYRQSIEEIPFHHNRYILQHCDFRTIVKKRKNYNKLYVEENNLLKFNQHDDKNGVLEIKANQNYESKLILKDNFNNSTKLVFNIQGVEANQVLSESEKINPKTRKLPNPSFELLDNNTLLFKIPKVEENLSELEVHTHHQKVKLKPYYESKKAQHFIWDLKLGIPDSAISSFNQKRNETIKLNIKTSVPAKTNYRILDENFEVHFYKNSLFNTVYFQNAYETNALKNENKELFTIGNRYSPLLGKIRVNLKPKQEYNKKNSSVYKVSKGKHFSYVNSKWKNNSIEFKTKEFGTYTILSDTIKPVIKFTKNDRRKIYFRIHDNLSGIKSYNAYLNGEWILMHYDYKRKKLWSERLDKSQRLKGEFVLEVMDNQENKSIFKKRL